jgi:hypothetical protein
VTLPLQRGRGDMDMFEARWRARGSESFKKRCQRSLSSVRTVPLLAVRFVAAMRRDVCPSHGMRDALHSICFEEKRQETDTLPDGASAM